MTEAKHRPPAVHAGAKRLVEIMLTKPGVTLSEAAQTAGLTTASARAYLGRPHVVQYFRMQKQRMLEEVSLGNPSALADIRDRSENSMARVQAVRTLEQLRGEAVQDGSREQRYAPGLVFVITGEIERTIGAEPPAPVIDVTPERETEAGAGS